VTTKANALVAHPGTQHSFHLARELSRHDALASFHTTLAINDSSTLATCLMPFARAFGLEKEMQNRLLREVLPHKLYCYPALEISTQMRIRRGHSALMALRARNEKFQRRIPDAALAGADAVIGFDTSSRILATRSKKLGTRFILDRSIGYAVNGLFEELQERFPKWAHTWEKKSDEDIEIEDREHELADIIVVPSQFVAETVVASGVSPSKIRINQFGTDLVRFDVREDRGRGCLIFLFVGALLARKGLPLLLEAWQELKPEKAELWIAGPGSVPKDVRQSSPQSIKWIGAVSREKVAELYRQADVLVVPSYFEGLAQVQIEAAACALPVIGTRNSGATEIIEDGETGYVIETGNLEQLADRLKRFLDRPELAEKMHAKARAKRNVLSWSHYGDRWQTILESLN
jgi:starch synthase